MWDNELYINLEKEHNNIRRLETLIEKLQICEINLQGHLDELMTVAWEGNAAQDFINYSTKVMNIVSKNEERIIFLKKNLEFAVQAFTELEEQAKKMI